MKMYAIKSSENNDEMWSNEFGWVNTPTFDLFTPSEKDTLDLPIGGEWVYMCGEEK